jgi:hypothetical protein
MYSAAEIMTSLMADDRPAVAKRCRNRGDRTRAVVPRGKKSGTNAEIDRYIDRFLVNALDR